jgi:hypothetical protein
MAKPDDPTKPPPPASTEQPHDPLSGTGLRRVSPEEARRLGIPIKNDLVISPVPNKASKEWPIASPRRTATSFRKHRPALRGP